MRPAYMIAILLAGGAVLPGAAPKPRRQAAVAAPPLSSSGNVGPITALPANIGFAAFDPDQGAVPGNTAAVVFWQILDGKPNRDWRLSVQAGTPQFQDCGPVPASAVIASCQGVTVSGGSGACLAPGPLSTSPRLIAGGRQDNKPQNLSVSVSFTFTDSWRYIAATNPQCTLTLTYIVDAE